MARRKRKLERPPGTTACNIKGCDREATEYCRMSWRCQQHTSHPPLHPNCSHQYSCKPPNQPRLCSWCMGVLEES